MEGMYNGNMGSNSGSAQSSHSGMPSSSADNMMGDHNGMSGMAGMNGGMMEGNAASTHSSHHGGGSMAGMGMMKSIYRRFVDSTGLTPSRDRRLTNDGKKTGGSWARVKRLMRRQMNGMMGGSGGMGNMMGNQTMMQMDGYWTHAMHLHLVVSNIDIMRFIA